MFKTVTDAIINRAADRLIRGILPSDIRAAVVDRVMAMERTQEQIDEAIEGSTDDVESLIRDKIEERINAEADVRQMVVEYLADNLEVSV